jgi:hypothetical protein
VSFFERAIANMPPPPEPEPEPASPSRFEPPAGVVPGQSTQRAVLFRTDRAVLVVGQFGAYPTGAVLNRRRAAMRVRLRRSIDSADPVVQTGWTNLHGS